MKTILFTITSSALLLFGCKKTETNSTNNSSLIIKAGFECGWGSGTDSLEISEKSIRYVYYIPSKSLSPQINKSRSVSLNEWTDILNDVNMDTFLQLHYQSCNICVDGCDEWIFVQKEAISHKIKFGKGLKIDSVSKLQNKLAALRTEFNN